jgi:hypothetical protein
MTVPTGTPDFQSVTQQHNQVLVINEGQTLTPGTHTLFSGASAAWASFQIRCTLNTGQGILTINWFTDSGLTNGVGTDSWKLNNNRGLSMVYPVQAAFCTITFNNTAATNASVTSYVVGTQIPVEAIKYLVTSQTLEYISHTVAANTTEQVPVPFICRGPCWLYMNPADSSASLNMRVVAVDEAGNIVAQIMSAGFPASLFQGIGYVPDQPLALLLINSDAVNPHTFTGSFVIPNAG